MERRENKKESTLCFSVGGKYYEIPMAEVERVLSLQRQAISPMPFGLGKRLEGLFSFRGAALPLIRIAGAPPCEFPEKGDMTVILLGTGAKRFGIAADSAGSITDLPVPGAIPVCARSLYEGSAADV